MVKLFPVPVGILLSAGLTVAIAPSLPAPKVKSVTVAVPESTVYSVVKGAVLASPLSLKLCKVATLFFERVIRTVFSHAG